MNKTHLKYYCIDCNKEISWHTGLYGGGRCYSCARKIRKIQPGFIDGRTNKKHYCVDCGKELSSYQAIKCWECHKKWRKNPKNNPMFGKRLIGELNGMHNKKHTKKSRQKMSLTRGGTGIPYENNEYSEEFFKIKPKIRKRDNYTCQLCNKKFDKYSTGLDVHHIDYDKENCKEENLISLCHQCNCKANCNREYWEKHFKALVSDLVLV